VQCTRTRKGRLCDLTDSELRLVSREQENIAFFRPSRCGTRAHEPRSLAQGALTETRHFFKLLQDLSQRVRGCCCRGATAGTCSCCSLLSTYYEAVRVGVTSKVGLSYHRRQGSSPHSRQAWTLDLGCLSDAPWLNRTAAGAWVE
jgi:hypothetical protein